ncbi:MAG: amino acid permease, partial [Oscillospiraceae bacterium]
ALLFLVIPNVSKAFLIINVTTMLLYCVVYVLIAVSAIRLRYTEPELPREFRLGKHGNTVMWIISMLALAVIVATMTIGLIMPAGLNMNPLVYVALQLLIVLFFVAAALLIFKFKKPSWKQIPDIHNPQEMQ